MKGIAESGPIEVEALKRRTIRSLAMGKIEKSDCDYITTHLDLVSARIQSIAKEVTNGDS